MAAVTRLNTGYSQLPIEAPPPQAPQPAEPEGLLSVRQLLGAVRRNRLLIAGLALVGTTLAWLVANQLTPIYQAEARLIIEQRNREILRGSADQGVQPTPYGAPETEAIKLRSEVTLRRVAREIDAISHPLLNPALGPPRSSRWRALLAPVLAKLGLETDGATTPPKAAPETLSPEDREQLYNEIADGLQTGLAVLTVQFSPEIRVVYRSPDPRLAALVANTVVQSYIRSQAENRGSENLELLRFLGGQIEEARNRVVESERELARFRADKDLLGADDTTVLARTLNELKSQLNLAEAAARQAEVRARNSTGGASTGDTALMAECARAQAEFGRAAGLYGPNHPEYVRAQRAAGGACGPVGQIQAQRRQELQSDAKGARENADHLSEQVAKLEEQVRRQVGNVDQLRALTTKVEADRKIFDLLLTRYKEVEITKERQGPPDLRQIQEAAAPGAPVSPKKDLIVLVAFIVSLSLGVAIAIALELMDAGFRSVHQLEQLAGVPALGMVPFQSARLRRGAEPWLQVVDKPNSAYSEAVRTVRTGIQLSSVDRPLRSVVVTSSVPGEGKTTTAMSLAAASAASGARTLIIDCDLRQPSLHRNLGVENEAGLAEFLSGQRNLEELVHVEPKSGLYYILAGKRPPSPTDLLGSLRMRRLLRQLGDAFDLVVIDTPPVMAVSDSLLLVRHGDATIFVVRWEKTRRDIATAGIKMVYEAGARMAGVVLTQVDLRRHAQYDYTDSGAYYYRGYKRYYGE